MKSQLIIEQFTKIKKAEDKEQEGHHFVSKYDVKPLEEKLYS
jgi:hypothetical protein